MKRIEEKLNKTKIRTKTLKRGRKLNQLHLTTKQTDSGTAADIYTKTDVCMKIGNCEQSCCLSKHTALRGRICWQRRCYSVCKTLIPRRGGCSPAVCPRAPRGFPQHQGCALGKPPGFSVLVLASSETPAGITGVPGQPCQQGTWGPVPLCPAKGSRTASRPKEKSLSVHASALRAPSKGPAQNPQPGCLCSLWGQNQALALARCFHPSHPITISSSHVPNSPDWILPEF